MKQYIISFFFILLIYLNVVYAQEFTLKQQLTDNIPINEIQCKNELHVLVERPNGKIACVSEFTAYKLEWKIIDQIILDMSAVFEIESGDDIFEVEYALKDGIIKNITRDFEYQSLIIAIEPISDGDLIIKLSRDLIDSKADYCPSRSDNPSDDVFFTLINGEEIEFDEILTTSESRTLKIPFLENTTSIEIIKTCYI